MYQDPTASTSTETINSNLMLYGELSLALQLLSVLLGVLLIYALLNLWQLAFIETTLTEYLGSFSLTSLPTSSRSEKVEGVSSGKQQDPAENSTLPSWRAVSVPATYPTSS